MASKHFKYILALAFSVFMLSLAYPVKAQDNGDLTTQGHHEENEKPLDPGKIILEHIGDAHEWHFFTYGDFHGTIPLPVILYSPSKGLSIFSSSNFGHSTDQEVNGVSEEVSEVHNGYQLVSGKVVAADGSKVYDVSLTKNVVQMLLATLLLILLMTGIGKKYKNGIGVTTAPKGWQNAIEPVITFIRDEVAKPNLGKKWVKFMPLLLTIFFFILINTLVGLLPGAANVTGNTAFTMILAIVALIVILASTNRHFWGHILWPPGIPLPIKFILVPIELAGVFIIKPAALMIRLFANMVAGHIVILSFISLIFIFGAMSSVAGYAFSPLSILFTVFIYFIELLVAFIQAFIFANLTAVFIGQSLEGGHDDVDGHADPVII